MRAGARSAGCIRLGLSGNRVLDKSAVVPVGSAVRTLAYTLAEPLARVPVVGRRPDTTGRLPEGGSDNKYIVLSARQK